MHKQITVTSIDPGKTKLGKDMWTIQTIEGEPYTIFEDTDPLIIGAFLSSGGPRGNVIAIDTKKNGEYENITGAKFVTRIELPDRISAADSKDLSVTLSYAVSMANAGIIAPDDVIKWAHKFYKHVTTMPNATTAKEASE